VWDVVHTTGRWAPQIRIREKDRMSPILADMFSYSIIGVEGLTGKL